jgi:hypothetical protein
MQAEPARIKGARQSLAPTRAAWRHLFQNRIKKSRRDERCITVGGAKRNLREKTAAPGVQVPQGREYETKQEGIDHLVPARLFGESTGRCP